MKEPKQTEKKQSHCEQMQPDNREQAEHCETAEPRFAEYKTAGLENNGTSKVAVQCASTEPSDTVRIAELESKVARYLDQFLRSQAELQNFKKRAEREITQIRNYANERFASELLAVKDSLEMGLQNDTTVDTKKLYEGLELTLKLLQQVFEKFSIKEINPKGEVFNPELHQAVSTRADASQPPNTVLDVLQKGYLMNDRLLRAAIVCVCSAPTTSASPETANPEHLDAVTNEDKEENEDNASNDTDNKTV